MGLCSDFYLSKKWDMDCISRKMLGLVSEIYFWDVILGSGLCIYVFCVYIYIYMTCKKYIWIYTYVWHVCRYTYKYTCIYIYIYLSIYLSICLSIYLSICLSIYPMSRKQDLMSRNDVAKMQIYQISLLENVMGWIQQDFWQFFSRKKMTCVF